MSKTPAHLLSLIIQRSKLFSSCVKRPHKIASKLKPVFLAVLDSIIPVSGQTVTIGDYGCADGGVSYPVIKDSVALLREKYGNNQPIQIVYADLPTNDFRPVFMRAQGGVPGVEGISDIFPNVSVMAAGSSFYSQCVPPNSIDLIFNSMSSHWLSECPQVESDSLFPMFSPGSVANIFLSQSEKDWKGFLQFRRKELKKGGYLLVCRPVAPAPRQMLEEKDMCDTIWKSLFTDGIITKAEYKTTTMGMYFLSKEELMKPFCDPTSGVDGLEVTTFDTVNVECPFKEQWEQLDHNAQQDPRSKINVVNSLLEEARAWQEGLLSNGLGSRSVEDKERIIDIFYTRYRQALLEIPLQFLDFTVGYLVIKKQS